MHSRAYAVAMAAGLLLPSLTFAKDKSKSTLPADVLQARTVAVVIDPNAGVSMDDPRANEVAQRDVETALLNWGRFQRVLDGQSADLIIVIRRGTGKIASDTIHDPRQQSRRPGVIEPTDTGIDVGAQHGQPPPYAGDLPEASQSGAPGVPTANPIDQRVHPQAEIGSSDDSFIVYRGKIADPLDSPPVWRLMEKNCLKPHTVPAVDVFRKKVDESEQAAAKQP